MQNFGAERGGGQRVITIGGEDIVFPLSPDIFKENNAEEPTPIQRNVLARALQKLSPLVVQGYPIFRPTLASFNWYSIPTALNFFLLLANNANVAYYFYLAFIITIPPVIFSSRIVELKKDYSHWQAINDKLLLLTTLCSLTVFILDSQGSLEEFILSLFNHGKFDPAMISDWEYSLTVLGAGLISAVLTLSPLGVYKWAQRYFPSLTKLFYGVDITASLLRYVVKLKGFATACLDLIRLAIAGSPTRYTNPILWFLSEKLPIWVISLLIGSGLTYLEFGRGQEKFCNNLRMGITGVAFMANNVLTLKAINDAVDESVKPAVYAAATTSTLIMAAPFFYLLYLLFQYLVQLVMNCFGFSSEEKQPLFNIEHPSSSNSNSSSENTSSDEENPDSKILRLSSSPDNESGGENSSSPSSSSSSLSDEGSQSSRSPSPLIFRSSSSSDEEDEWQKIDVIGSPKYTGRMHTWVNDGTPGSSVGTPENSPTVLRQTSYFGVPSWVPFFGASEKSKSGRAQPSVQYDNNEVFDRGISVWDEQAAKRMNN